MKESIILTIGITSYNRVAELERCLKSIDTKYYNNIEIVISEDKSPKKKLIKDIVINYGKDSKYFIQFNSNNNNLGYDNNLKKIIDLSKGIYILLMSDDDIFNPGQLDILINELLKCQSYGLVYTGFCFENKETRRLYESAYKIPKGEKYISKHIYDSILFSGLVFNRLLVKDISAKRFLNTNYFQVYLFLYSGFIKGGYYLNIPLIQCIGDGENGYGLSESSIKNELLANRKSPLSVLEFHKGLIKVIDFFDKDYNTCILKSFKKEYNIRSIVGMSIARENGKSTLREYKKKMDELNINNNISKIYYLLLYAFGTKITLKLLTLPKLFLFMLRREKSHV